MSHQFALADSPSAEDLRVYLARAARVDDGFVRLLGAGSVLAVYIAVLHPSGLLDRTPTVLGLRTFALAEPVGFDIVVASELLRDRLDEVPSGTTDDTPPAAVTLPSGVHAVTWAAISPPRGGWVPGAPTDSALLERVAASGISEVALAIPARTGEQLVQRVRGEVWGRSIDGLEHVPAGGAFAASSLGFLGGPGSRAGLAGPASRAGLADSASRAGTGSLGAPSDGSVDVYEAGPWVRLSTPRGHVLIKRRPALPAVR